jgi:hypothetical protein
MMTSKFRKVLEKAGHKIIVRRGSTKTLGVRLPVKKPDLKS